VDRATLGLLIPILALSIPVAAIVLNGLQKLWKLRIEEARVRAGSVGGETEAEFEQLHAEIDQLRLELSEVQERLDFTERMVARASDRVVIYTAITNGYDRLQSLRAQCVSPARQIAFLDEASRAAVTSAGNWEIRDIDRHEPDPTRLAKLYKVLPHLFFPDAHYSLWVDGNVSLIYPFDIHRLISLFLADADMCVAPHHARACLYQEAAVCKARRLDSARVIDRQVARYRSEGFPVCHGLNQATVILRRHSEAVKNFNQQWWQEICQGSRRDQLSFNYVLWKVALPIAEFPLAIQDNNGLFAKIEHARRRSFRQSGRPNLRAMLRRMEGFHFGSTPPAEST